ncbi:MAG: ankyrin repeat domain-containing protein, partial [Vicinamibacterales bacterium]
MAHPLRVLAAVLAAAAVPAVVHAGRDDRDGTRITLERPGCAGACPRYQISIDASGAIVYEGRAFVRVQGRQTDRIPASHVIDLLRAAERLGVWNRRDPYPFLHDRDGSLTRVVDRAPLRVTIQHDGRSRVLEAFPEASGIGPFADEIDRVARTSRWVTGEERPPADRVASPSSADAAPPAGAGPLGERLADALGRDDLEAVKALLAAGADPNASDATTGFTPLTMVRSAQAARALLAAGASPFRGNAQGETPLGWAVTRKPEVVAALLRSGVSVDQPHDADGRTPLWTAACLGNASAVVLLLAAGANPHATTSAGVSALACARAEGALGAAPSVSSASSAAGADRTDPPAGLDAG